jgi:hypothetical protein
VDLAATVDCFDFNVEELAVPLDFIVEELAVPHDVENDSLDGVGVSGISIREHCDNEELVAVLQTLVTQGASQSADISALTSRLELSTVAN